MHVCPLRSCQLVICDLSFSSIEVVSFGLYNHTFSSFCFQPLSSFLGSQFAGCTELSWPFRRVLLTFKRDELRHKITIHWISSFCCMFKLWSLHNLMECLLIIIFDLHRLGYVQVRHRGKTLYIFGGLIDVSYNFLRSILWFFLIHRALTFWFMISEDLVERALCFKFQVQCWLEEMLEGHVNEAPWPDHRDDTNFFFKFFASLVHGNLLLLSSTTN